MVERTSEKEVIPFCIKNGIAFVPFSPIASGLLSGKITPNTKFANVDDVRIWVPQLKQENITRNMPIVEMLKNFAAKKHATPAQITLAWMLHKYPNVMPIPGSKNKVRIIENLQACETTLTDEEFNMLEASLTDFQYMEYAVMRKLNRLHSEIIGQSNNNSITDEKKY